MRRTRPWRFTSRVLIPVVLLGATMVVLVAGVLVLAVERADRFSDERETAHVDAVVGEAMRRIPHEQESVTIWDDAVDRARLAYDDKWVDANLGRWMLEYFRHDRAYVIDPKDELVYGLTESGRAAGLDEATRRAALPILADVRQRMRARPSDAPPPPAAAGSDGAGEAEQPRAVDVVVLGGRPAIVSAMPIVSDTGNLRQEPGSELVHVAVRFLDGDFVHTALEEHLQTQAHFSRARPPAGASAFPLRASSGETVGWFVWTPARPGERLLGAIAPVLVVAFLVVGAIIVLLVLWLRRSSQELLASEAEAQRLALHDPLTGLPNRALFANRLEHALGGRRTAGEIAVLYIDLDHFKSVNDTLGHDSGDALICAFGARVAAAVRPTDTVARIGGDEFAVLLTGINGLRRAEDLCQRILDLAAEPFDPGAPAGIGVSVGIAVAPASDVLPGDLLRNADIALYEAKRAGRNCFRVFSEQAQAVGTVPSGLDPRPGVTPPSLA